MKPCTRFHVEDVEAGDVLHFLMPDEYMPQDGPREFDLAVAERYETKNFGWVVRGAVEGASMEVYLEDGWNVIDIVREEQS